MTNHPKSNTVLNIIAAVLVLSSVVLGFWLAGHKPLWNDEIYSQTGISGKSYLELIGFKIQEGNICPLFYVLQKIVCDVAGYKIPYEWNIGDWGYDDPLSKILLRIQPVLFMSLAIVAIFYYFTHFYGWWAGLYSLIISFSSYMVWAYFAEARPYALWVFFSAIQSLIFLMIVDRQRNERKLWNSLIVVHFLLSLTVVLSLLQIMIVSFLLWLWVKRGWKHYIFLTVIPAVICIIYLINSPRYAVWFTITPEQLIRDSFARERFYIVFIFLLFLVINFIQNKKHWPQLYKDNSINQGIPYFMLTVLMVLAAIFILTMLKIQENHQHLGFPVASRYFIYLTPVAIIATVFFSIHIVRATGLIWLQVLLSGGLAYFVILRVLKVMRNVVGLYPGLF